MANNRDKNKQNILITILLLVFLGMAGAQDKAVPPPTKIQLPSDTTKAAPRSDKKIDADKPAMELPDVLIKGQDRAIRDVEAKKDLQPESPTLVQPDSPYEPVFAWFQKDVTKPKLTDESGGLQKMTWGSLQGGGYTTVIADAGHWQKIDLGSYRAYGWVDRSSGQYNNSAFAQGGISGEINYEMAPQVTGNAFAQYELFSRGMHGAAISNMKRSGSTGRFGANLQYDVTKISGATVGFEMGGTGMRSDTSSALYDKSNDFWYNINFNYSTQLGRIQLTASGKFIRDAFKLEQDSVSSKSSMGGIGLEAFSKVSNTVTAALGVNFEMTTADYMKQKSRPSPYGRINIISGNEIGLTALFSSGYDYRTFSDWRMENPYLAHAIPLHAAEDKFALRVEAGYQMLSFLKMSGSFSRSWKENMFFWQADPVTQFINLYEIQDPELTEIHLGLIAQVNERTRLQAFYIGYSDKIDKEISIPEINGIPYRPDFRLPVRATIELLPDMILTVEADVYGERRSRFNSEDRLPAFGLMHVNLSKTFSEKYTALFSVRNLLDSDYVLWENYPETGVYILLGLRAKL
ncbi:TonB-dependent receptor [candidate division KSB1 bacterium]|nr:TonB-dependent receptor [candidate division KSB1 bacterium]